MVITQKVTGLAFNIHDGFSASETELSKSQKQYAVKTLPTCLEYFSYVLQFPTVMAGPALFYNDYISFINGDNLTINVANVSNSVYILCSCQWNFIIDKTSVLRLYLLIRDVNLEVYYRISDKNLVECLQFLLLI